MPDHSDYNTDLPDIIVWGYQPLPTGSGSGGGSGENLENNMARAAALDMLDQGVPREMRSKGDAPEPD